MFARSPVSAEKRRAAPRFCATRARSSRARAAGHVPRCKRSSAPSRKVCRRREEEERRAEWPSLQPAATPCHVTAERRPAAAAAGPSARAADRPTTCAALFRPVATRRRQFAALHARLQPTWVLAGGGSAQCGTRSSAAQHMHAAARGSEHPSRRAARQAAPRSQRQQPKQAAYRQGHSVLQCPARSWCPRSRRARCRSVSAATHMARNARAALRSSTVACAAPRGACNRRRVAACHHAGGTKEHTVLQQPVQLETAPPAARRDRSAAASAPQP